MISVMPVTTAEVAARPGWEAAILFVLVIVVFAWRHSGAAGFVVRAAGGGPEHIGRMTVVDLDTFTIPSRAPWADRSSL